MNKLYERILNIKYMPRFLSILIIILINWTFQSFLYMDKTEKFFKIMLEFIFFVVFFVIFQNIFSTLISIIISLIISHSINWIFNGHIYALFKNFGVIKTDFEDFKGYIDDIKLRSAKENSLRCVATFGSLSRLEIKETSDLDIRVVRKEGLLNGFNSCLFVCFERSRSFFKGFPLDIYVLDNIQGLYKLDENPIMIFEDK